MQKWGPNFWGCHGVYPNSLPRIFWFPVPAMLFPGICSWYRAALRAEETAWSLTEIPTCADMGVT